MKKKILFGNNIAGVGKALSRNFVYFGFEVSNCSNSYEAFMEELNKDHYDGIFLFINQKTEKLFQFLEYVKKNFPETKIYVLAYLRSRLLEDEAIEAGAFKYFVMPASWNKICCDILYDFFSDDELIIMPEIFDYLAEKNIPNNVISFYFLCIAVEKTIYEPEMFSRITKRLYPYIAETMNTSITWVERSIRKLGAVIYDKKITFNNQPADKRLSNKELISAAASEFVELNGLKK